jgi:carbohydrate diacid regulator
MYLREIAEKIVHNMMEVIDNRNINIMDREGFILASGEESRINTYHKGADDVIRSGKTIEIYPEQLEQFPGAKEGVNMPISIQGKVIGVVGVFGHPEEVRMIAKLVKKSVELGVEQSLISKQIELVKDLKQQLIRFLIYEDVEEIEEEILCIAKIAKIDLPKRRCAVVLEVKTENITDPLEAFKITNEIEEVLLLQKHINKEDFGAVLDRYFVLFKTIPKDSQKFLNQLYNDLNKKYEGRIKIGMGSFYEKLSGYKKSFYEAKELLAMDHAFPQNINLLDIQAEYLLGQIPKEALQHFIEPIYRSFLDSDNHIPSWILETLYALLENNLSVTEASESLYIHKNTLLYRIKKIEQLTGISINNNFYHAILMKLLLIYINKIRDDREELK